MTSTAGPRPACSDPAALDAALRALHGSGRAGEVAALHEAAAALEADPRGARFHLTHAWVHALEAGDAARVAALEARLRAAGGL